MGTALIFIGGLVIGATVGFLVAALFAVGAGLERENEQ